MKPVIVGAVFLAAILGGGCMRGKSQAPVFEMEQLVVLEKEGRLTEFEEMVTKRLEDRTLTADERRALEFERERARRIRQDYRLSRERLWELIQGGVAGVTLEEFEGWLAEGKFDFKMIDGTQRFVGPSVANLFFRNPQLADRRIRRTEATWDPFLLAHIRDVKAATHHSATKTGTPHFFRLHYTNTVRPGQVPEGEVVRCWMVYPQQTESQSGVMLEQASPQPLWINEPTYPMRSLYFEQPSGGDEPTVFEAVYTTTSQGRHVSIDPGRVAMTPQVGAETEWFLREQLPHMEFVPELRELAASIVGDETNPAIKARLIYDWVAANIQYSYAREYSTLRNISLYCYTNRYGDCGQIALLYMTLCRISGVPARWQSGWVLYPMHRGLHDWCEVWLAPYGWVPVDPNYGVFFGGPRATSLTPEENAELKDFFFGGLDAYRLIVNSDHSFPHYPAKEDFRSDTVDFQRGELEAGGRNLYFNQFGYALKVEELSSAGGRPISEEVEPADTESVGPGTPGRER